MSTENMPSTENDFVITRTFDAPRELMWRVWSEPAHLANWWGPKGFTHGIQALDFRTGGTFHYCNRTPDGVEVWGKFIFREIVKPERIVFVMSFSDASGGITRHFMSDRWPLEILSELTFTEHDGKTTLTMRARPINAAADEIKLFTDGRASMQQGFGGTFEMLQDYLASVI